MVDVYFVRLLGCWMCCDGDCKEKLLGSMGLRVVEQ